MNTRNITALSWLNILLFLVLQVFLFLMTLLRFPLPDWLVWGIFGAMVLDGLLLASRWVNHPVEIGRYLVMTGFFWALSLVFLPGFSNLALGQSAVLSFFLGCLLVRILTRAFGHRFKYTYGDWDFIFDPINWVFTVILMGSAFGFFFLLAMIFHLW